MSYPYGNNFNNPNFNNPNYPQNLGNPNYGNPNYGNPGFNQGMNVGFQNQYQPPCNQGFNQPNYTQGIQVIVGNPGYNNQHHNHHHNNQIGIGYNGGYGNELIIEKQGLFGQNELIIEKQTPFGQEVIIQKTGPFGFGNSQEVYFQQGQQGGYGQHGHHGHHHNNF